MGSFPSKVCHGVSTGLSHSCSVDANPLWPLLKGQRKNVHKPPCLHCGSPGMFELHILLQLLYFLQVKNVLSSLDWVTIVVYSCEKSCTAGVSKGYAEEFACNQLQV